MKITSLENYKDFSKRCEMLHKRMMECKKLGYEELITIEGLIYAYAEALVKRNEYDNLSTSEKVEFSKKQQDAVKFILEFTSEQKHRPLMFNRAFDIDKYLKESR